jgi:cell division protein FtsB
MATSKSRLSHKKEAFYISCIVIAVLIGLLSWFGPYGYRELKKTQSEVAAHRVRVEALRKSNEDRLRTVQMLKENPEAIEDYARRKGYAKKGEIIQEVPQAESSAPPVSDVKPQTLKK